MKTTISVLALSLFAFGAFAAPKQDTTATTKSTTAKPMVKKAKKHVKKSTTASVPAAASKTAK